MELAPTQPKDSPKTNSRSAKKTNSGLLSGSSELDLHSGDGIPLSEFYAHENRQTLFGTKYGAAVMGIKRLLSPSFRESMESTSKRLADISIDIPVHHVLKGRGRGEIYGHEVRTGLQQRWNMGVRDLRTYLVPLGGLALVVGGLSTAVTGSPTTPIHSIESHFTHSSDQQLTPGATTGDQEGTTPLQPHPAKSTLAP